VFSFVTAQDTLEFEGVGEGAHANGALMAAKKDVIEKGIGMVLLSQTEIENFQVKRDLILTKMVGSVKGYQIISQSTTSGGLIKVKIKAVVSKSMLRDDLAAFQILIKSMNKPKVMVVISENNGENSDPGNQAAENAVMSFLKESYGFELVDKQGVLSVKNSKQKMAALAGNDVEAASIATQYGAEVLIAGIAICKRVEDVSQNAVGMVSVQADVTLKAISCANGRIIASSSERAVKGHLSPQTAGTQAIAMAAEKTVGKFLDVLVKDWQNQVNNGMPITVEIRNVNTFRLKNALVQTLKGVSGVSSVYERSWDAKSGLLGLDVQYKGNPNSFAAKVDGYKMKSGGGSFAVTGMNGQAVSLAAQAM